MSTPTHMVITLTYGDLVASVELPTRPDGALPYALAEVTEHVGQMFRQAALDCGVTSGLDPDGDDD